MYNDKNRQMGGSSRTNVPPRTPYGRSCPAMATDRNENRSDIPDVDDRIGRRLCDGTLPDSDMSHGGCGDGEGGWGLHSHPLAMVYSPLHEFRDIYTPDVALDRGTMFAELDLPFEGGNGRKGGCC